MLTALLFFAGATIDYQTVAKPLPEVLKELSAISGVEMRASEGLATDKLVIRVNEVEIDTLRAKLATAATGKWTEKDGVFIIQRDEAALKARGEALAKAGAEVIRRDVIGIQDDETPPYAGGEIDFSYPQAGIYTRFLGQVLEGMNLEEMAAMQQWTCRVYSNAPTRMQHQLHDIREPLQELLKSHNDQAARVAASAPDLPVGSREKRMLDRVTKKWTAPLRLVLTVQRSEMYISVEGWIIDAGGDTVQHVIRSFMTKVYRFPDTVSGENLGQPLELSPISKEYARLFVEQGLRQLAQGAFRMSLETQERFKKPNEHDPLNLHFSETLLGLSQKLNRQLIAQVDYSMLERLQSDSPTVGTTLASIFYSDRMWNQVDEDWMLIGSRPLNDVAFEFKRLQSLFAKLDDRTPTLDETAQFAASTPTPKNGYLVEPYLRAFLSSYASNPRTWHALRVYHSMPLAQRRALRDGQAIRFSDLLPGTRAALAKLVFDVPYSLVYINGELSNPDDVNSIMYEPTEALPNGIPPNAVLRMSQTNEAAGVAAPKAEGMLPGTSFSAKWLGIYSTSRASSIPNYQPFWPGDQTNFELILEISPNWSLRESLVETRVAKKGEPINVGAAPAQFKKEYDESVADRIRRQGGGG